MTPVKSAEREKRLAAALRENLKRRKAQARALTAQSGGEPPEPREEGRDPLSGRPERAPEVD